MAFDPPIHWWATVTYLVVLCVGLFQVTRASDTWRRALSLASWPVASTVYLAQTFCGETDQCLGVMPSWSVSPCQAVITIVWFVPLAVIGDLDIKRKVIIGASVPLYLWLFLYLPAYTNATGFYQ